MRNIETDEFYIGYAARLPQRVARTTFRAVIALVALAVATAGILVFAQQPFAHSVFEFGEFRDFVGVLEPGAYPALLVPRPRGTGHSRYLLVERGKHGAGDEERRLAGSPVTLRGSLIYRAGQTMVEVVPGSVKEQRGALATVAEVDLGEVVLTGEIVDSKCYLGVMNPGRTKVHRDCAARCISGGIPPALATSDGLYLLVGRDGRALGRELLEWVGETIRVRGDARRSGETLILRAEPGDFHRPPR